MRIDYAVLDGMDDCALSQKLGDRLSSSVRGMSAMGIPSPSFPPSIFYYGPADW